MKIEVPIKIHSEANKREHWACKYKRRKTQKFFINLCWNKAVKRDIRLPVAITLTRYGKRRLDYDNLVTGFKWARDCVSDLLIPGLPPGRADDDPRLSFEYKQEKSKKYFITVEIQEI